MSRRKETIRVMKEAVEHRRLSRKWSLERTDTYMASKEEVRKVHISEERCTSL